MGIRLVFLSHVQDILLQWNRIRLVFHFPEIHPYLYWLKLGPDDARLF